MPKNRRSVLRLEPLDDRIVPAASLRFSGGSLFITSDNTSNTILIAGGAGSVSVTVNGVSMGTYALTGGISVTTGNGNDLLDFALTTVPGNLTISTGNGNDTVQLHGGARGAGTVAGQLSVNLGTGDDVLFTASTVAGPSTGFTVGGLTTITGGLGAFDTWNAGAGGPADTVMNGPVTVTGMNQINWTDNVATRFGSSVVINNSGEPGVDNDLFSLNLVVAGSLTYVGGSGTDDLFFAFNNVINGGLTVLAGESTGVEGGNFLDLGGFGAPSGNQVGGNVLYQGGSGLDVVTLGDVTVSGSASLLMGDGDNNYNLGGAFTVGGDLTIRGGNGADPVGNIGGAVRGNLTLDLGGGTNSATVGSGVGGSVGGTVRYTGGSGLDSLTVSGTNGFTLYANLGAGADTFTYAAGASVGAATIDFGVDTDTDVYTDNGVAVTWPQTLLNYP